MSKNFITINNHCCNFFPIIFCLTYLLLGLHCETNMNECNQTNLACHNGGTCVDGVNGYTCQCPARFSGPFCNVTVTKCDGSPCQNDGTCTENVFG